MFWHIIGAFIRESSQWLMQHPESGPLHSKWVKNTATHLHMLQNFVLRPKNIHSTNVTTLDEMFHRAPYRL